MRMPAHPASTAGVLLEEGGSMAMRSIGRAVVGIVVAAVALTGCSGPGADGSVDQPPAGETSETVESTGAAPGATPTPAVTPSSTATFTFEGIDGVRLGMTAAELAVAFPDARIWREYNNGGDSRWQPAEPLAERLALGDDPQADMCPIIGTWGDGPSLEVKLENGVVVGVAKAEKTREGAATPEFETESGLTESSALSDFERVFGAVFVTDDGGGNSRWVLRGTEASTMQISFHGPSSVPLDTIAVVDAGHTIRIPHGQWWPCRVIVSEAPDFS